MIDSVHFLWFEGKSWDRLIKAGIQDRIKHNSDRGNIKDSLLCRKIAFIASVIVFIYRL